MKVAFVALTCALLISSGFAQQSPFQAPPPTTPAPTPVVTPSTAPPTPSPTTPVPTVPSPTRAPAPTTAPAPASGGPTTAPTATPTSTPTKTPAPGTTPAAAAGGAAASTSTSGSSSSTSGVSDTDILFFAYQLEVLEAQFYSCAAFGTPVDSKYLNGGGSPSGCTKANLTSNVGTYASELAREETAHVALLQSALASFGVKTAPANVDITTAFNNAAAAALKMSAANVNPPFNPSGNDYFFLHAAFIFEDLGVSAYLGALNLISNSTYRLIGAQIGATEAYHSSLIRTLLYQTIDVVPAYNLTVRQITDAIVAVLNTLGALPANTAGSAQLKYAIYNAQGASISNVDSNALAPYASTKQVTKTVTLGAADGQGGGFFPNNLNGAIKN